MQYKYLLLYLLLQSYFSSNMLSFGFWKSDAGVFWYMAMFYSIWLVLLTSLLLLGFRLTAKFAAQRLICPAILLVFSLPFLLGLYAETFEWAIGSRWIFSIALLPALFLYYYLGSLQTIKTGAVVAVLIAVSFMGHAELPKRQTDHPDDPILLDRAPNIHVIMLDAFTHASFSEEFMAVDNPAADYLATLEDTIYAGDHGFVEAVPTIPSWVILFDLEKSRGNQYHDTLYHDTFSGQDPSRLTTLLRKNNYYVQTGANSYLGSAGGRYVDHYSTSTAALQLICMKNTHNFLLGLCSEFSIPFFAALFLTVDKNKPWHDQVIERIAYAERNIQSPIFSGYYIYHPIGHTTRFFKTGDPNSMEEYKKHFNIEVNRAHKWLQDINQLRKQFPDSVFIISGDHGPWLSRTSDSREAYTRFWILDRHAVALALLNSSNLCPWSRQWLDQQKYLTPGRMLVATLACNGDSRRLTAHFRDNKDFVRFSNPR